tara:strand:- start:1044 stop:3089 length:2046 start_codon:yes stop_codon:yes gene_type:complete
MKNNILTLLVLFTSLNSIAQDWCESALPITAAGLFNVAVIDGTAPTLICTTGGNITNNPLGEWYTYTPSQDYTVTITTNIAANSPLVDTRFHVYTGDCSNLVCFAGDDDSGTNYSSIDIFNVTGGTTYYIAWDNRWSSNGFTFEIIENTVVIPPVLPITYTNQTISTINSSYNICIVDMDGDHIDDLVGISANNIRIHHQTNPGVFSVSDITIAGTSKMPSWSMAAGDYNRDGFTDLVLGAGNGLSVWTSNNTGTAYSNFSPSEYVFCQRTNFADLNNDGNLDVFSCHDIAPNVYYLNDASNNLTYYQSSITPGAMNIGSGGGNYSTLFTDFDNDGDTDVFISKCSGPPCELHRNDGNGVYTNISALAQINITPIQTWSSAIADFDNDGDMDIIITASSGMHHYFKNNLDTTNSVEEAYTEITSGSGWDINSSTNIDNVAYDFDNDGFVDVLGGGNKIMFNNSGDGTFSPVSYSGLSIGAIGDLNNDGFLDIQNGTTIRYANPNANNWLKVSLQGVVSNINGIGARIEIMGTWGKQIRDVRSGEGFRYMSSLNAHFGLGLATIIDEIKIIWPSGTVDVIQNPAINQALTVVEGSSTLGVLNADLHKITLYPNPASNRLMISNTDQLNIKNIAIYSTQGKKIKTVQLIENSISVEDLAEGLYILTIQTVDGEKYSESFVKSN